MAAIFDEDKAWGGAFVSTGESVEDIIKQAAKEFHATVPEGKAHLGQFSINFGIPGSERDGELWSAWTWRPYSAYDVTPRARKLKQAG